MNCFVHDPGRCDRRMHRVSEGNLSGMCWAGCAATGLPVLRGDSTSHRLRVPIGCRDWELAACARVRRHGSGHDETPGGKGRYSYRERCRGRGGDCRTRMRARDGWRRVTRSGVCSRRRCSGTRCLGWRTRGWIDRRWRCSDWFRVRLWWRGFRSGGHRRAALRPGRA